MERRKFLKSTAIVSAAPLLFNHIPVLASSQLESSNLQLLGEAAANCGKILVIIQLNGGNDGLNTVFPRDKWGELTKARSNILMNENDVLPLAGNITTGFHPAMKEMKNLYDNGKMMIVQGVSYPNPSYSHFRATDIWFTASDSDKSLQTGWLGRALDTIYPNFPIGYPNANMPDPLAIQIGSTLPFSLQGPKINMAYSVPKPEDLLEVVNATTDPAPNSDYGHELTFLRLMKDQSNTYRTAIQKAYNVPKPLSATYPIKNELADQLKIVARLINGGLQTPIYIVNHPKTHDTHEGQVMDSDKKLGKQAENLTILSQAIGAFQEDLRIIGKTDKVTGMTFSEFGRRIKSNDSAGTDHGSTAPVIFFGAALNTGKRNVAGTAYPVSGMIGKSPELPPNADVNDEIPKQFDFRQIYSTLMQDWLCMTEAQATTVLGGTFEKLPVFRNGLLQTGAYYDDGFISIFPNPVTNNQINIQFNDFIKSNVNIIIYTIQGAQIFASPFPVDGDLLSFDTNTFLSTGTYILELEYNGNKFKKKVLVM
jgi:uncharacterized protein (DUF1501 family)